MPQILFSASVTVPQLPRARFLKRLPPGSARPFEDVTGQVAFVNIVRADDNDDALAFERLDDRRNLVWSTRHYSVEEIQWQAEFEYELTVQAWKEPVA